jgi:hypothetical protein
LPRNGRGESTVLIAWLISHQPAILFSQNKPVTNNHPAVLLSRNKPTLATGYQPLHGGVIGHRALTTCREQSSVSLARRGALAARPRPTARPRAVGRGSACRALPRLTVRIVWSLSLAVPWTWCPLCLLVSSSTSAFVREAAARIDSSCCRGRSRRLRRLGGHLAGVEIWIDLTDGSPSITNASDRRALQSDY